MYNEENQNQSQNVEQDEEDYVFKRRITTRDDLDGWIADAYGSEYPDDNCTDRVLDYLEGEGFRWGNDIGNYDIPDSVLWNEN